MCMFHFQDTQNRNHFEIFHNDRCLRWNGFIQRLKHPPIRGTESEVAGMISATSSMKTVSESSTVMPWGRDKKGDTHRQNMNKYILWWGSVIREITPVITHVLYVLFQWLWPSVSYRLICHVQGSVRLRNDSNTVSVTCGLSFTQRYLSKHVGSQ